MGPIELRGIKVLGEKAPAAKGKVLCLPVSPGLPVGKENTEERVWLLSQGQWDTDHPATAIGRTETTVNVSGKSNIPNSSDQDSHSPQMDNGAPATLSPSS